MSSFDDAIHIDSRPSNEHFDIRAVGHEPTLIDKVAPSVHDWEAMRGGKLDYSIPAKYCETMREHDQAVRVLSNGSLERALQLRNILRSDWDNRDANRATRG